MSRGRPTLALIALIVCCAAAAGRLPIPPLPTPADPFPIRRVYLPPERVASTLLREQLTQLPRDEFEAKVRAAARSAAAPPPRLLSAGYTAALTADGLTGTATFNLTGRGLAALAPFGPAVRAAKWADGSPAVLIPAAGGAAVWVPKSSDAAVSLDWSARGTTTPSADRFDLTLPAVAVASLTLDLPADRAPTVEAADLLVTGPFPGSAADRRRWSVALGGSARVTLLVTRPAGAGSPPPLSRADRSTRYDLAPGTATVTADFDLTAVRDRPSEWLFDHDPALTVTGVTGPGRLSWTTEPGRRLRVTAGDPAAVRRVTVAGLAAVPADGGEWPCPTVRLTNAVPGADAVEVRLDPDLTLVGCDPGGYRVADARADSGYRLALTGALAPEARRPPRLTLRPTPAKFTTTDEVTWQLAGDRSTVTARFKLAVTRGPLARIPVAVPAGFAVESVRLVPDDPELTVTADPPAGLVTVEPVRPLTAGQSAEVVATFRGPPVLPPADPSRVPAPARTVPFPQTSVVGAGDRTGTFGITVGPGFRAWAYPHQPGPLVYPVRGRPPAGTLAVAPSPPRAVVSTDTAVSLTPAGLTVTATLTVRCQAGEIGGVTLFTPGGGSGWQVTADGGTVERVPGGELVGWAGLLAGGPGWGAVGAAAAGLDGSVWRVRFGEVGAGETTVRAATTVPAAHPGAVTLPAATVLGATAEPPDVRLDPAAAARYEPAGASGFPARVRLLPRGAAPPSRPGGWLFADLDLLTRVGPDGGRTCTFTGRLTGAGGHRLPVQPPAGAVVLGAAVDGKQADPAATDGGTVWVPVPDPGDDGCGFELRYRLPAAGGIVATLDALPPTLPADEPVRTRWAVDRELRAWPTLTAVPDPADGPPRLTVVRTGAVRAAGWGLAAAVVGAGVGLVVRGRRLRWTVGFVAVVGALGAAGWVVPDGWRLVVRPAAAAGLLVLVGWVVGRRPVRTTVPPAGAGRARRLPSTASYGTAAVLLGGVATAGIAQAPGPATVYVVREVGRLSVLAPPAVLDKLAALTRPPLPAVAVVAAEYDGSAAGPLANFTARFTLQAGGEGPARFALPLTGVRVAGMELDGEPAFPTATAEGYTLAVGRAGPHALTVRFAVPVGGEGVEREVRFGGPDVPVCRVRFAAPGASGPPDVPTRRGGQTVSADGRHVVEADHGGGGAVRVRWPDGAGGSPRVDVKEVCVWDVSADGGSAVAAALFTVTGGTANEVGFDLPAELEPGLPTVRGADGQPGPGLRDWRLDPTPGGGRRMTVRFASPADGRIAVTFPLYPTTPPTARPTLRFPRAIAAGERYAAVRATGVGVEELQRDGVIDYPADVLAREFGGVPELGLERPPGRVFQRSDAGTAAVRPALRATAPPPPTADVTWTVGRRATVEGALRPDRGGPGVIAFDLPPSVRVTDVGGAGVVGWSRAGQEVQVWLSGPRPTTVRWAGELTELPTGGTLSLPVPATGGPVSVRVRPADGWVIGGAEETEVQPGTAAVPVTVFAPQPPAGVRVREATDGSVYRATVSLELAPGRPHRFTLRAGGVPTGAEAAGPAGVTVGPPTSGPDDTGWPVSVPAAVAGRVTFTLTAKLPGPGRLPEPVVTFDGPPVPAVERTLSAAGGLAPTTGPAGWHHTDRPDVWAATGSGRWAVAAKPTPEPGATTTTSEEPATTMPEPGPAAGSWLAAVGWLAGLGVVLAAAVLRPGRGVPEVVLAVGLLGVAMAGAGTTLEAVFAGVAAVGAAGRIGWGLRRVAGMVLR